MPWLFAKRAAWIVYAAFCFLATTVLSIRGTEWMIGEPDRDGDTFTICTIPAPTDDTSDVALPVTLFLIAPLLLAGLLSVIRQRRAGLPFILGVGLLLYWAWLFFGRTAFC